MNQLVLKAITTASILYKNTQTSVFRLILLSLVSYFLVLLVFTKTGLIYGARGTAFLMAAIAVLLLLFGARVCKQSNSKVTKALNVLAYLLCILLFTMIFFSNRQRWFGFDVYIIPSVSMQPTLQPNDVVLAQLSPTSPAVGEVWIFTHQNITYVKRVTDTSVEGIWVQGDNKSHSLDSRHYGWLPSHVFIARVPIVLFNTQQPGRYLSDTHSNSGRSKVGVEKLSW